MILGTCNLKLIETSSSAVAGEGNSFFFVGFCMSNYVKLELRDSALLKTGNLIHSQDIFIFNIAGFLHGFVSWICQYFI